MSNEGQIFQEIVEQINVNPIEIDRAIERHSELTSEIIRLTGGRTIISGSYRRNVAVSPLKDIDLFVWLPKSFVSGSTLNDIINHTSASDTIDKMKALLKNSNIKCKEIRRQSHSVGVFYDDLKFKIDVIPAFAEDDPDQNEDFNHLFWIPERDTGEWLKNHPKRNERRVLIANKKTNNNLHNIIRLLKYWMKLGDSDTFKSFHLELLVCYLAYQKPEIFSQGIYQSFCAVVIEIESLISQKTDISKLIEFEKDPLDYLYKNERRYDNCLNKIRRLKNQLSEINSSKFNDTVTREKIYILLNRTRDSPRQTKVSPDAPKSRFG